MTVMHTSPPGCASDDSADVPALLRGFGVRDSRLTRVVQGLVIRVQGSGFRVEGSGLPGDSRVDVSVEGHGGEGERFRAERPQ